MVCTITVNPRRANAFNTTPPYEARNLYVQRIGGLTFADPIYVLMIVLQRASDTMMVAMTIKTNDEYHRQRSAESKPGLVQTHSDL
jgi:hypothetical protein